MYEEKKVLLKKASFFFLIFETVVSDYINTMMTTFYFCIDLDQVVIQHGYTKSREAFNQKAFLFFSCNLEYAC